MCGRRLPTDLSRPQCRARAIPWFLRIAPLVCATALCASQEAPAPNLLYVLDPVRPDAFKLSSSTLSAPNAFVYIFSRDRRAAYIAGESTVTVRGMLAVGGTSVEPSAKTMIRERINSIEVRDPLANIPTPEPGGLKTFGEVKLSGERQTAVLEPGVYEKLEAGLGARGELKPGVFAIRELYLHTGASLTGKNVLLYVGKLRLDSNARVNLTAASEGPYKDLALFVSRRASERIQVNTNASLEVTGTVYGPAAAFTINSGAKVTCSHLVVNALDLSTNAALTLR